MSETPAPSRPETSEPTLEPSYLKDLEDWSFAAFALIDDADVDASIPAKVLALVRDHRRLRGRISASPAPTAPAEATIVSEQPFEPTMSVPIEDALKVNGEWPGAAPTAPETTGDTQRVDWLENMAGAEILHRSVSGRQSNGSDADAEWYEVRARGVIGYGDTLRAAIDETRANFERYVESRASASAPATAPEGK